MSHLRRARLPSAVVLAVSLPFALVAADPADPATALDRALQATEAPTPAPSRAASGPAPMLQFGGAGGAPTVKLADVSLDINTAAGGSTATDAEIATMEGGDHDPKRRGFTLQQAEISLFGAVDPYFNAEAHIVYKQDGVEIEEAYGSSTSLPYGLQLKAGYYLTEFGRTNPQHPHQWPWLDQPVVNSRIFGPDGTRGVGARVSWLAPLPWFSELFVGMQNADNPTEVSFLGSADPSGPTIGGRPVVAGTTRSPADFLYSARWVNDWELDRTMLQIGVSGATGPNLTGPSGRTDVGGLDLLVKWRAARTGYPNLAFQTELIGRRFEADDAIDPVSLAAIGGATLDDVGACAQLLLGFRPRWAAGLRVDYATGRGDSYAIGTGAVDRAGDPFRDDRVRVSPLLTFNPSEFSKLRLQYDYDHADHLEHGEAHSVWLGLELMIGAHPAHNY